MKLKDRLQARFPDIDPARLPGGFDRVGDIAVIGITPEAAPWEHEIGALLLALHPATIRVVAKRTGAHGGEYRTLPLRVIAGEERLATIHRENGVLLHLDLSQVYFSVRSAHERARIAAQVQPGERVAVLCSGVGPFPLVIGRHSKACEVIGIEKNPVAHELALRNLRANRTIRNVRLLAGDVGEVLPNLDREFDRLVVVLPHGGETLLPCALDALRPGGILHFYDMQAKGCSAMTLAKVDAACRTQQRSLHPLHVEVCGHCGPALYRLCLDAVIDPHP